MNFKKPLSLLLIAGLVTAQISIASSYDSNARKAELKEKKNNNEAKEISYFVGTVCFGCFTCQNLINLVSYLKDYKLWDTVHKAQYDRLVRATIEGIKKGIIFPEFAKKNPSDSDLERVTETLMWVWENYSTKGLYDDLSPIGRHYITIPSYASEILSNINEKITLTALATAVGSIATIYCSFKAYKAWSKAKEAEQELAALN